MGCLTLLSATFPQPCHWERIFSLRGKPLSVLNPSAWPGTPKPLPSYGPPREVAGRFSFRFTFGALIWRFSFWIGLNLGLSPTHSQQQQALAWWRWPRRARLYFHFPPGFLSTDQREIASASPRQTNETVLKSPWWHSKHESLFVPNHMAKFRCSLVILQKKLLNRGKEINPGIQTTCLGWLVFAYFVTQTEEELIPASGSCNRVHVSMKLPRRRTCLLGARELTSAKPTQDVS